MIFNLESLRAVVRPFASRAIGLSELLERLWPMLLGASEESQELVSLIQDLLALQAAGSIDDIALRQRLIAIAFYPGEVSGVAVSDVHPQAQAVVGGGILPVSSQTGSVGELLELIPA